MPTQGPWPLRILPDRLRLAVWSRVYRGNHSGWLPLYSSAPLQFAPGKTLELLPGDVISDSIAFTGLWELALTRHVAKLAARGGLMIEIGANLGYFAVIWTARRPDNRCIAIEPSPRNVEFLQRNFARNELSSQVEIWPVAAGEVPGRASFELGSAFQTGWGGLISQPIPGSIDVEVVRVDERVPADQRIGLLKIDIEGADVWALKGCDRLLKARQVEEIWYEQNKPRMQALGLAPDVAENYLRSVGYTPVPRSDPSADIVDWSAACLK